MNKIKQIECRKCGSKEEVYMDVESRTVDSYSRKNTFFCKDCDHLTTIDTVSQRMTCKSCRSNNLTKFFPESKVKCSKCGMQGFDTI